MDRDAHEGFSPRPTNLDFLSRRSTLRDCGPTDRHVRQLLLLDRPCQRAFTSSPNGRERFLVRRFSLVAPLLAISVGAGANWSHAAQEPQAAPPAPPTPTLQRPVSGPFLGGVPTGTPTETVETITVIQALTRSLEHNLGVLAAQNNLGHAEGTRWRALSDLLPNASGRIAETRQRINLQAFGFGSGDSPSARFPDVGPFNVFDARIAVSQAVPTSAPSMKRARRRTMSRPPATSTRAHAISSSTSPAPCTCRRSRCRPAPMRHRRNNIPPRRFTIRRSISSAAGLSPASTCCEPRSSSTPSGSGRRLRPTSSRKPSSSWRVSSACRSARSSCSTRTCLGCRLPTSRSTKRSSARSDREPITLRRSNGCVPPSRRGRAWSGTRSPRCASMPTTAPSACRRQTHA